MIPRIHLAVDNCFASKRWTEPIEWMQIARDAGIFCVEASADNECDPLYNTPDTLQSWLDKVQSASLRTGVKVVNLYSGHGTYAMLGLAHTDTRIRDHIQHNWLEPIIHSAAILGAGLGFFCHAFPQSVLFDPTQYAAAESDLFTRLSELAVVAASQNMILSVEQMYSPHQIPWTINGSQHLLQDVYNRGQAPLYLTLDTGHQIGQGRYLQPGQSDIEAYVAALNHHEQPPSIWIGPVPLDTQPLTTTDGVIRYIFNESPTLLTPPEGDDFLYRSRPITVNSITDIIHQRPYLFATPDDGDLYHWLRTLGCYSPIIHLQQTDGTASAHRPFTEANNRTGIVKPPDVLRAIWDSYQQPADPAYPPFCPDLYLTLEIFSGTAENPAHILNNIRESAAYWRQFIAQDGLPLDQLISHL